MTDYCKHGVKMTTTCRKCGRTMVVEVPDFAARKHGFTNSISLLEETVAKMTAELAGERAAPRIPAAEESPEPPSRDLAAGDDEETPPPAPPERFPWQRR
jgi:hypothetical protein